MEIDFTNTRELHKFYWEQQKKVEYWEHSYYDGWKQMTTEYGEETWRLGMPFHAVYVNDETFYSRPNNSPLIRW